MEAGAGSAPFAFPPSLDLRSVPAYPRVHDGAALVVGSAACAIDDFREARWIYPTAAVMAVNRTANWIRADFLVSIDRRQAQMWREMQEGRFGKGHFTQHGGKFGAGQTGPGAYPWFDHWWPGLQTGGTSAWLGAKILAVMGFDRIVLACDDAILRTLYRPQQPPWLVSSLEFFLYQGVLSDEFGNSRILANFGNFGICRFVFCGIGCNRTRALTACSNTLICTSSACMIVRLLFTASARQSSSRSRSTVSSRMRLTSLPLGV